MKTILLLALVSADLACGAGRYLEISYPASTQTGELQLAVTYTVWIPDHVTKLRGVIVHQHGCGAGASRGGETAAYDLQWQALAAKWDSALLGPSYKQADSQNCALWSDPKNGSDKTFLKALGELAAKSSHPELETVPWTLWGHSGGGTWVGGMQALHPARIVAIWFRSGAVIPGPDTPEAAYEIPMMCNTGIKEKDDARFHTAWEKCMGTFKAYRAKGAPIGFAPDPKTSHECGDSRYLAIPFFDACLRMRLPAKDSRDQKLKPVEEKGVWLGKVLGEEAEPAAKYEDKEEESVWLPDEHVAKAWMEYVKTGTVSHKHQPPTPFHVVLARLRDHSVEISWDAESEPESGIKEFIIQRDGQELAQYPEKPVGKYGKPLFQSMGYHDTPTKPLPEMRYMDTTAKAGVKYRYQVIAVSSDDVKSKPKTVRLK
ncbi:MAG: hypothetical protein ABJF23_27025 [Bryobacteraceae bacterium]